MEIFKINIKPQSEIDRHESFKHELHDCPLCDARLEFSIEQDSGSNQIVENAYCKSCDVTIDSKTHKLH